MSAYVISSDSDDAPLARAPRAAPHAANAAGAAAAPPPPADGEDPDWVKTFTPTKTPPPRSRRAAVSRSLLAPASGLVDGSDEGDGEWDGGEAGDDAGGSRRRLGRGDDGDAFSFDDDDVLDLLGDDPDVDVEAAAEDAGTQRPGPGARDGAASPGAGGQTRADGGEAPAKAKQKRTGVRSSMPLVVAPKLDTGLVLVQARSAALDLSGDVGAVGRVRVGAAGLGLDVKGTLYSCELHATNMVCVVSVGDDEAKVTAAFDEVLTMHEDRTTFVAGERLLSGALDEELGDDDKEEATQPKATKPRPRGKVKFRVTKPKSKAVPAKGKPPRGAKPGRAKSMSKVS